VADRRPEVCDAYTPCPELGCPICDRCGHFQDEHHPADLLRDGGFSSYTKNDIRAMARAALADTENDEGTMTDG
jgi:hypothetical protein